MIRPVAANEISLLCKIAKSSFYDTFIHSTTEADMQSYLDEAFSLSQQAAEFEQPNSAFYFMEVDEKPVAYLKLNFGKQPYDGTILENPMEIQRFYFLHSHIGQGLGNELMEFALSQAIEKKHANVWLGVWEFNARAQAFYRRYGFSHFGQTQADIGNTPQIDWLWNKPL